MVKFVVLSRIQGSTDNSNVIKSMKKTTKSTTIKDKRWKPEERFSVFVTGAVNEDGVASTNITSGSVNIYLIGRYVAPEVFRNEEYDTQVDVFSFALILQEGSSVVSLYDEVSLQNVSDVTADWIMKQRQVLRNKLWLGGFSRYLGEANSYVAELWAVWEGLKMARGLGFSKIELQIDSKAVMASISNHMADSFDDRGLFLRLSCFNGL
ncbi:hypothetical protein OROHE_009613 [Orobanche hederae]